MIAFNVKEFQEFFLEMGGELTIRSEVNEVIHVIGKCDGESDWLRLWKKNF